MTLELAAMRWLWLEQNCITVICERTPVYGIGQPDVLGVTPGRYLTEIEVKRSVSDFRADFKKPHRFKQGVEQLKTRQFYYMVAPSIVSKVEPEIPEWAGLMTIDEKYQSKQILIKKAPVNKNAIKLNLKQCVRLARAMTNHAMSVMIANHSIRDLRMNDAKFDFAEWVDCEKGTYLI